MNKNSELVAKLLLQINAIKLKPASPFTWASGWKSPIYCDNRKTLSHPNVRTQLRDLFVAKIKEEYPEATAIAGVATGAIAIGALVADAMGLPFVYIRAASKGHGLQNKIEGEYNQEQKFVIIEDLVSTGMSSLSAYDSMKEAGLQILGMVAIFTYNFPQAVENFSAKNCQLSTLSSYDTLIETAQQTGYVSASDVETLKAWRLNPSDWGK